MPSSNFIRSPGVAVAAITVTAAAAGLKYRASTLKQNEKIQSETLPRNFYVSVERSGGGI